eukprot:1266996-Rhodomonas_salina.4
MGTCKWLRVEVLSGFAGSRNIKVSSEIEPSLEAASGSTSHLKFKSVVFKPPFRLTGQHRRRSHSQNLTWAQPQPPSLPPSGSGHGMARAPSRSVASRPWAEAAGPCAILPIASGSCNPSHNAAAQPKSDSALRDAHLSRLSTARL